MSAEECHSGYADHREREKRAGASKKGVATVGVISIFLMVLVAESSIQKLMLVRTLDAQIPSKATHEKCEAADTLPFHRRSNASSAQSGKLLLMSHPTVHEAYEGKVTHLVNVASSNSRPSDAKFKTRFEPNKNVVQYGLTGVTNVCMRPNGTLVMVRISEDEIAAEVAKVPELQKDWRETYNCSSYVCMGVENVESVPADVKWVPGTTEHIIPHLENVFHNFGDCVWPHIMGFQPPLSETMRHHIDHFLVHRLPTWLHQAKHNIDRNTFMYQIRFLGELAPKADFLVTDGLDLVCFERLILACTTCDRMSRVLSSEITTPGLLRYRNAALSHFGLSEPLVNIPPNPLRVTFYGRRDTKRRRIANTEEVVAHLRRYSNPPLAVTVIDDLLETDEYNQTVPEVVSLLTQTDILITVHGANTWAAIFLPKHAAVIEIEGPCGPYTWLRITVEALGLKHDTSNPFGEAVAAPDVGNTTRCVGFYETPDFTLDLQKLDAAIYGLAVPRFGSEDRIPLHWLYDWQQT